MNMTASCWSMCLATGQMTATRCVLRCWTSLPVILDCSRLSWCSWACLAGLVGCWSRDQRALRRQTPWQSVAHLWSCWRGGRQHWQQPWRERSPSCDQLCGRARPACRQQCRHSPLRSLRTSARPRSCCVRPTPCSSACSSALQLVSWRNCCPNATSSTRRASAARLKTAPNFRQLPTDDSAPTSQLRACRGQGQQELFAF